ncbi:MAG TPA: restriction endonuclease subunit S [Methylophilus sp.]|uniref:restriction endonuclease subunit S n=1 Tax=Methylophilus sp. TaxID=29541 RepID=UPI002C12B87D|nr:restriction endonuclease subunit S [Methylophilus sp.]HSH86614.1 restriction endonuclease subunit S [Methylophilus sp.]
MKAGWEVKTLNQIAENLDSKRVPITKTDRTEGHYPYYGASGIVDYVGSYIFECDTLLISEDGANLLARSTPIAFPATGKYWVNNHAHILKFDNFVTQRYVELYFESIPLDDYVTGAAQPKLNQKALNSIPIPVPPFAEQQRIVAILDQAFEGIAKARANAEQNLQSARALFESHLQSIFTQHDHEWEKKRLGNVVTRLTNGYVGPTRNIYNDSGVPYLLARHVKNNQLLFDGKTFITEEFNRKNKKSILKEDDVLLVQSGHIGHSAVVTKEHEGHNCHAMIVISAVKDTFIGSFLSLFFNSSEMKQKFQEIRSGSTVPHLTCGEVKELMVPLPNLATQQVIVNSVREFQKKTQRLEALYQRKIACLDELKKSLLQQAFAGDL